MAESAEEKRGREQLSRMAYEAQLLQGQGRALEQQVGMLAEGAAQLSAALESLKSLKSGGGAALVPLGGGAMAKADIRGGESVLIDVGAGVVVEMGLDEAVSTVDKRLKDAERTKAGAERDMLTLTRRLQVIDSEARGLMQKLNIMPGE